MARIKDARTDSNKEFTDFKLVRACNLYAAVIEQNPVVQVDETQICIYAPLFQTLSTASGKALLKQLIDRKTLKTITQATDEPRVYSSVRQYFNLCYHLGDVGTTDQFYSPLLKHSKIVLGEDGGEIIEAPETVYVHKVPSRIIQALQEIKAENQRQDAIFHQQNPDAGVYRPNHYDVTPLNNAKEEDDLAEAVAAHGMTMIELKRRFAQQQDQSIIFSQPDPSVLIQSNEALWNAQCDESISRIHLRIVLGPDYKTPENFLGAQNPRREADLANIKEYFHRYTEVEYEQKVKDVTNEKDKAEFKRQINLLDSDYEFFAEVLAFEEDNKQWPTFYHGASENLNNLFRSFTYLRELISLNPLNGLMALRGTDIYFKDAKTVQELLGRTGDCESDETKAAMLFLNFTLFAGRKTTVSTSSSAEYVINDHSVSEPNLIERFEEALALAGFSKPIYDYYQSLFEQYVKYKRPPLGNSVLVAISQSPQNMDTYNYATGGGGSYYGIPSTLQVLHDIQAEYERQKAEYQQTGDVEVFNKDPERKRKLFPENRMLLHPSRVMSPKVKIKSFDRFPLSSKERQDHDREMRITTVAMLADWLSQKSAVMEGSFIEYPALKRLHKMVYKGVTGKDLQETICVDGFIHLVRNGHLDAVKGYLTNYPRILDYIKANQNSLINAALESNNPCLIDYLVKDILGGGLNTFLNQEDFLFKVRELMIKEESKPLLYLMENYDLSQFHDAIKLQWCRSYIRRSSPIGLRETLQKSFPANRLNEVLDIIVGSALSKEQINEILETGFFDPQNILEKFCIHIQSGLLKEHFEIHDQILALMDKGVNISAIHPAILEPIVFMITKPKHIGSKILKHPSVKAAEVVDLRNQEGLTLLQAVQKDYLSGKFIDSSLFYSIIH